MAYSPTLVIRSFLKPLCFHSLKKGVLMLGQHESRSPRNPIRASDECRRLSALAGLLARAPAANARRVGEERSALHGGRCPGLCPRSAGGRSASLECRSLRLG